MQRAMYIEAWDLAEEGTDVVAGACVRPALMSFVISSPAITPARSRVRTRANLLGAEDVSATVETVRLAAAESVALSNCGCMLLGSLDRIRAALA